jgi:hypothetical protein
MPDDKQPKVLFDKPHGRGEFRGLLISRKRGDLFLLPIGEITWVSTAAINGGGCVEIHTRQKIIRLALDQMDACREFVKLLFNGDVSRINEGTAPLQSQHFQSAQSKNESPESATLVIDIIEPDEDDQPPSPAPQSPQPQGLGFPLDL